jgi:succinoglycan biosynthesis protein ExoV
VKLYRWRGAVRNFGDELNTLLWPRLLPGLFDDDESTLFLGIGSVLDARHSPEAIKLVVGSGYGGYQKPATLDARWLVHWVRGPRTALLLGLPASRGLGDPAMLLPLAGWPRTGAGTAVGFMPHFESLAHGAWREAAAAAGVELIDPRGDPAGIIEAIGRCRLLLCEAMHGAIVADALRVPWVALRPLASVHHAKWRDWADALGMEVSFQPLSASSLSEWLHASRVAKWHHGRCMLRVASPVLERCRFVHTAADALRRAARAPPQLSPAVALDRCQSRMLEHLDALRHDPLRAE